MKIQQAEFLGVAGVPDLRIDLPTNPKGEPHGRIAVTGPCGSGKTRLLEALVAAKEAIRPYGPLAPGAPWIRSGQAAKVRLTFWLDDDEREFSNAGSSVLRSEVIFRPNRVDAEADDGLRAVLGRYSHQGTHGKVDYFPAERRIPTFPPFAGLGPGEQRVARLSKDARKYGFVVPFLQTLASDTPRRLRFEAALASLSTSCRYVPDASGLAIPRCFSSRGADTVSVGQLSHAESDAVVFAATAAAIGLDHSLILLDRPELHADEPEALLDALGVLGQDNQLWMTCSPRTAAAAHGVHVVSLKR
jgi:hypothetical protein